MTQPSARGCCFVALALLSTGEGLPLWAATILGASREPSDQQKAAAPPKHIAVRAATELMSSDEVPTARL